MVKRVDGIFVPVVTPFDSENQSVGTEMLEYNIERLNHTDISGYMPLGSNGESFMMTDDECCRVIAAVKKVAAKEKLIFAGTGRESEYYTIEFTKRIAQYGVDAVFVLTPHYFPKQMGQDCLRSYYEQVADRSPVPILLYQAPAYAAGVSLETATVAQLAKHPNIIGMKGTASNTAGCYMEAMDNETSFSILAGTFGAFCENVRDGAAGGVLSCANYIPHRACELYNLVKAENCQADTLYQKITGLINQTTGPLGVGGVKMAMNILGYQGGVTRRPLPYPKESQVRDARSIFMRGDLECR